MHGDKKIWTTAELKDAGWGEARTRRALGDTLHRVARGVYTTTMDTDVVLRALALAHPGIVFTGRTAAYLHYALPMEWPATACRTSRRHNDDLITIRRRRPGTGRAGSVTSVRGVDATTAAQTAVDLDNPAEQVRVLERGYSGLRGTENFEKDAAHLSRTGRRRLAAIRSKAIIGTASNLETQAVQLIRSALRPELEAGLITIETNAMVRGYCWDIMIPEVRLLIEIDSWAYHGEAKAKRMDFARDRCKGNQATRWGYLLLRYPDSAVKHAPHYVSDEVADAVRFELQHLRRFRREDEAIPTDAPMWLWFPKV